MNTNQNQPTPPANPTTIPPTPAAGQINTPAVQPPQATQPAPTPQSLVAPPAPAAQQPAPQQTIVQPTPRPNPTPAPSNAPAQPPQATQPAPAGAHVFGPPANPPPPNNPPASNNNNGPSQNRFVYLIGAAALVLAFLALILGTILFWPKGEKEKSVDGTSAPSVISMTVEELDARLAAAEAAAAKSERAKVEVERPALHPVESYGVATFRPTTTLNEMNSRNVPTISRTEAHSAPNGKFHLLYGIDPVLKTERMITVGGDTVTLLEPDWKTSRPKGKLVLLETPPKGLRLPVGRHAVAIVEQ